MALTSLPQPEPPSCLLPSPSRLHFSPAFQARRQLASSGGFWSPGTPSLPFPPTRLPAREALRSHDLLGHMFAHMVGPVCGGKDMGPEPREGPIPPGSRTTWLGDRESPQRPGRGSRPRQRPRRVHQRPRAHRQPGTLRISALLGDERRQLHPCYTVSQTGSEEGVGGACSSGSV